ncbi:MAG: hypothetical protein HFK08_08110 [Clostridia bacterium]|nr:hypothetical protein [Clostridia bacterium]
MKKFLKNTMPLLLALTLCVGLLAACGGNDPVPADDKAEFKTAPMEFMSTPMMCTLVLDGGNATYTVTFDSELPFMGEIAKGLGRTGTYEFKDNVYTVKLGSGETQETLTSTYDDATQTYSISYTMSGRDGEIPVVLTYKKAA